MFNFLLTILAPTIFFAVIIFSGLYGSKYAIYHKGRKQWKKVQLNLLPYYERVPNLMDGHGWMTFRPPLFAITTMPYFTYTGMYGLSNYGPRIYIHYDQNLFTGDVLPPGSISKDCAFRLGIIPQRPHHNFHRLMQVFRANFS